MYPVMSKFSDVPRQNKGKRKMKTSKVPVEYLFIYIFITSKDIRLMVQDSS